MHKLFKVVNLMRIIRLLYQLIVPQSLRPRIKNGQYSIRALFYKGNNVHCPCCNHSFDKFLPFGLGWKKRENAACPSCNSLERTRLTWLYLLNEVKIDSMRNANILHFAPERYIALNLKKMSALNYISADLNPALADIKVNIENIQFDDNYFDVIVCSHVLAHVYDEDKALTELYRVLKPGGWALIITHIFKNLEKTFEDKEAKTPKQRLNVFGQDDLARMHGKDFPDRLRNAGFKVKALSYADKFSESERKKYGLRFNDVFHISIK